MKASELTPGDLVQMAARGVVLNVTVVEVSGDKAIVLDKRRPGMRFVVGLEHLSPRQRKERVG